MRQSIQDEYRNRILQGDAIEQMMNLRQKGVRVHHIATSPPYFGVRNYLKEGQIGREEHWREYLEKLWKLFDHAYHVLYDYGTVAVNLGDTMNGYKEGNTNGQGTGTVEYRNEINDMDFEKQLQEDIPDKSYMMIPERFAIGMMDRGWVLRSKIIWRKRNVRPESQTNRFTLDWEYIFFFSKSNRPLFWTNERTYQMVWTAPLGINGVQDVDWYWKLLDPERHKKTLSKVKKYMAANNGLLPPNFKLEKDPEHNDDLFFRKTTLWAGNDYYFDTVYEPYSEATLKEFEEGYSGDNIKDYESAGAQGGSDIKKNIIRKKRQILFGGPNKAEGYGRRVYSGNDWNPALKGRVKRCVWEYEEYWLVEFEVEGDMAKSSLWDVNTKGFKEAHFAVYPVELVEIPVKACVPEYVCPKCGYLSLTIYDEERINTRPGADVGHGKSGTDEDPNQGLHTSDLSRYRQKIMRQSKGYHRCSCNAGFQRGIVLDPFMGSGTTALAALMNGRDFIGFELNEKYIDIALKRIDPLLNNATVDPLHNNNMRLF